MLLLIEVGLACAMSSFATTEVKNSELQRYYNVQKRRKLLLQQRKLERDREERKEGKKG